MSVSQEFSNYEHHIMERPFCNSGNNFLKTNPLKSHEIKCILVNSIEVFLNAFAKGLAKLLPKTLCGGIMNKDMNK